MSAHNYVFVYNYHKCTFRYERSHLAFIGDCNAVTESFLKIQETSLALKYNKLVINYGDTFIDLFLSLPVLLSIFNIQR
jgi:hypothetical protein